LPISKILVANRSEIAIRVFRAANELGIKTVAIWAEEDKLALHRFKADESYQVGRGPHLARDLGPIESYLSIEEVIRVAKLSGADAIHPGYGLLVGKPGIRRRLQEGRHHLHRPEADTMRQLGNKVAARNLAIESACRSCRPPSRCRTTWRKSPDGRGNRLSRDAEGILGRRRPRHARHPRSEGSCPRSDEAKREAMAAFGKDEVYLEKLIERARHVESQVLGDTHGNVVHLFERDCSIQRRNQKVVERAPAPYLAKRSARNFAAYSLKIAKATNYIGAGTVEYLMDADTGKFYFIEVNPRIQVEHTVTEVVTGIDIVKAQIHILDGFAIGTPESGVPASRKDIRLNGHALQCRITTEDPEHNFIPDYGRITAYRGPPASASASMAARPIPARSSPATTIRCWSR
jgi:pyruvate carboxylase